MGVVTGEFKSILFMEANASGNIGSGTISDGTTGDTSGNNTLGQAGSCNLHQENSSNYSTDPNNSLAQVSSYNTQQGNSSNDTTDANRQPNISDSTAVKRSQKFEDIINELERLEQEFPFLLNNKKRFKGPTNRDTVSFFQ